MIIYITLLAITIVIAFTTTVIAINKTLESKALHTLGTTKITLIASIFLSNAGNIALVTNKILVLTSLSRIEFNMLIEDTSFSLLNSIGFLDIYFLVFLTIALTAILVFTKERQTLYMSHNYEGEATTLCDHCVFDKLDISKNTFEEDEILQLIKEQPEKIDLIKKLLK